MISKMISKIKNKTKAQLSIFLIIVVALFLVLTAVFIFSNFDVRTEKADSLLHNFIGIENYVADCLEEVSKPALLMAGMQGGHIFSQGNEFNYEYGNLSYGFYLGQKTLHSKEYIENQISEYVEQAIDNCLDFSLFPQFSIEYREMNTSTVILDEEVIIELEYPFIARDNESERRFDKFIYRAPVRLGHIHKTAESIVVATLNDPDNIDIGFLASLDLEVSFFPGSEEVLIYTIVDNESIIDDKEYLFMFANKFLIRSPPEIIMESEFIMRKGKIFVYPVSVIAEENSELTFYSNTILFDITDDGIIAFQAKIPGEYDVRIEVYDQYGSKDYKDVTFIIVGD